VFILKPIMTKHKVILLTFIIWLIGVSLYGYWYVAAILSKPDLYGYERWEIFPIMGFFVDRFPILFVTLLVVIYAEAVLLELFHKEA
jgi:hypothetical protein